MASNGILQINTYKGAIILEWILPLLILLIATGWVYSDAKERGSSSPAGWAIGVLALMIIFLPLYLIMRPSKAVKNAFDLCPFCGKYYESRPTFCPNCGHGLQEVHN